MYLHTILLYLLANGMSLLISLFSISRPLQIPYIRQILQDVEDSFEYSSGTLNINIYHDR